MPTCSAVQLSRRVMLAWTATMRSARSCRVKPPSPPPPAPPPAFAPAPAQAPPAAAVADDPKTFGFTAAQQHTLENGLQRITANIANVSSNQKGETFVLLDNGQTWSVSENDGWLVTGQALSIKRASMRAYLMRIPSNHTYYVHRLK